MHEDNTMKFNDRTDAELVAEREADRQAATGPGIPVRNKGAMHPLIEECRMLLKSLGGHGTDSLKGDGSQFIWPEDEEGNVDPSTYWWEDGNYSCDCNRCVFLPGDIDLECGHTIKIDRIIPLDPRLPELNLYETGATS